MLLTLYKFAMQASTPLLEAYLQKRARRGKEDVARAGERRGQAARPRPAGPLLWFHAASVGESLSLLAIIEKLLADYPMAEALVTTGTVTSAALMAERLPRRAFHQYMPVDHPLWVARFLDHWRPDAVLWSESEFWPNMLGEIRRRRIPAVLLNARMSAQSFGRWSHARGTMREILSTFDLCLGQNAAETARLSALGAKDARVSANLKYAAQPLPDDAAQRNALAAETAGRPLLLFASTHPGEEEIALDMHARLLPRFADLVTVIVPRHAVRGAEIAALAEKRGFKAAQRSKGEALQPVYIADTMGELGIFYRLCPVSVIGGSFADIGGHNPIEPGQLGSIIVYGPQMYNFTTISEDFLGAGAALQVKDTAALETLLVKILEAPADYARYAKAAEALTLQKRPVTEALAETLRPYLDKALLGREAA